MAVVNRCAVAVSPQPPMVDWSRPFWTREDMESLGDEKSLYLVPTYDDEASAMALLEQHHGAIFEAELELWCLDRALWPSPRDFTMFRHWFQINLFPLVEDLGSEVLQTYLIEPGFSDDVRQALP